MAYCRAHNGKPNSPSASRLGGCREKHLEDGWNGSGRMKKRTGSALPPLGPNRKGTTLVAIEAAGIFTRESESANHPNRYFALASRIHTSGRIQCRQSGIRRETVRLPQAGVRMPAGALRGLAMSVR